VLINPYCSNRGHLFEDFKEHFERREIWPPGVEVKSSDKPLDADVHICIRSSEAGAAPSGSPGMAPRLLVQFHDFKMRGYERWQHRADGFVFVHHRQLEEFPGAHGYATFPTERFLYRPIGARKEFFRDAKPPTGPRPLFGFAGRDYPHKNRKLFYEICEAANAVPVVTDKIDSPEFFDGLTALVVTSEPEPGPLCIYEAWAMGVPVLCTPREFDRSVMANEGFVNTPCSASRAYRLGHLRPNPRRALCGFNQDDWITQNLLFAKWVAR